VVVEICELGKGQLVEGITGNMEEKLKRKKRYIEVKLRQKDGRKFTEYYFPRKEYLYPVCTAVHSYFRGLILAATSCYMSSSTSHQLGNCNDSTDSEAIQDDMVQSPDSEEPTCYKEYSRRELPRCFKSTLEGRVSQLIPLPYELSPKNRPK
jgi:hypothetical protein